MSDPIDLGSWHADPQGDAADAANNSTPAGEVPTNPVMAALHQMSSGENAGRRRNWLLGLASSDSSTPRGVPDAATLSQELDETRERLDAAEKRAREAEMALPHLLGLGQRTVNGLLNDARARAQEIVEEARVEAAGELQRQRDEMRREARELDSLRMAVAAEAMGLEQIRSELQRRISSSADAMARVAEHPMLLGGEPLSLDQPGLQTVDTAVSAPVREIQPPRTAAAPEPAPPVESEPVAEVAPTPATPGIGIVEASVMEATAVEAQIELSDPTWTPTPAAPPAGEPSAEAEPERRPVPNPSAGFADAWAAEEDADAEAAFERFFSAELETEPSRDWILADDTTP